MIFCYTFFFFTGTVNGFYVSLNMQLERWYIILSDTYRSPPSCFPSQSSHRERLSVLQRSLLLSLKVPVKESPPPTPFQVRQTGPLWREMLGSRAFFSHILQDTLKKCPTSRFLSCHRERRSFSIAFLHLSLKVPGKTSPPPPGPQGAPK